MAVVPAAAAAAVLAVDIAETVLIQIVGQLVSATLSSALAPEFLELEQESFRLTNTRALDPALAIDAFVKGHRSQADAQNDVAAAGYDGELFNVMAAAAGEPPGLDFLTEAWRRGFIAQAGTGPQATSLEQGIRESRLKNKWTPIIERMQYRLPDPSIVIEGWLRAQIDQAQAYDYLAKAGVDQATADLWYKSSGRPPGPSELIELYRRGAIPEAGEGGDTLSLRQGYLETDLKNKWYSKWLELARYVPPPRTVTAMVREGAMSDARAVAFYKDAGLDQQTAAEYLDAAHHQRTAAAKELSKATALKLYTDKLISAEQVTAILEAENYAPDTIRYELEAADFAQEAKLIDAVLSRLRTLYIAHKLDKTAAGQALTDLGLDPAARDHQLAFWDQARQNNVAVLTPAQIGELVKLEWLSFATGAELLQGHGYSPSDAQLFLIAHLKTPAAGPFPAGVTVSPQ